MSGLGVVCISNLYIGNAYLILKCKTCKILVATNFTHCFAIKTIFLHFVFVVYHNFIIKQTHANKVAYFPIYGLQVCLTNKILIVHVGNLKIPFFRV